MQWLDLWRYALAFHMLWQSGSDLISKTRTILGLVCTLEIDSSAPALIHNSRISIRNFGHLYNLSARNPCIESVSRRPSRCH